LNPNPAGPFQQFNTFQSLTVLIYHAANASILTMSSWVEADQITQTADDRAARQAYEQFVKSQNELYENDQRALGLSVEQNKIAYFPQQDNYVSNSSYFDPPGLIRSRSPDENSNSNHQQFKNTNNTNKIGLNSTAEIDDMQQTLLMVRRRLRAQRLQDEHQRALAQVETFGTNVTSSLEKAADEARMTLAEQIRSQHTPVPVTEASGLSTIFPKKAPLTAAQLRQELSQRKSHWSENDAPNTNITTSSTRGRRKKTTVDSFGGLGLGEMLGNARVRRQQQQQQKYQQQSQDYQIEQLSQGETKTGRNRRTLGRKARPSDFGGSLGDILQSSNIDATQPTRLTNRTITRQQRPSDRHENEWAGVGSLDDVLSSSSSNYTNQDFSSSIPQTTTTVIPPLSPPRRRITVTASDFGGSLGDILPQHSNSNTTSYQSSTRITAASSSSSSSSSSTALPTRRAMIPVSISDFGGSLGDILPQHVSHQEIHQRQRRTHNNTTSRQAAVDDNLLREFVRDEVVVHNSNHYQSGNFMDENEMTYDRLLALDANTTNRRLTVAQKSKETTPDSLFKSLQTATYRSKKKIKKKKNDENDEEEDECAICLCEFEHRCAIKKFPCGHGFHSKCAKEMLKFDTRCALCRFDIVTKTHG
jgi:hypothetical protein